MLIDCVKRFFEDCPLLGGAEINVNYLGGEGGAFCIEVLPSRAPLRRYVDGGELRSFDFVLASREFYDADSHQNMENAVKPERLCAWIEGENRAGRLPKLDEGLTAQSIEAVTGGYVSSSGGGTARVQVQCRLLYRK